MFSCLDKVGFLLNVYLDTVFVRIGRYVKKPESAEH
jgi:hypothetical protein